MASSITTAHPNRIAGQNSTVEVADSNGVLWEIQPDTTNLLIKRQGQTVATLSQSGALLRNVVDITTSTYSPTVNQSGTLFTNSGGACTVTLPTAVGNAGVWFEFFTIAAGDFIVVSTPADKMVADNDAEADSVAFSTDTEEIGNCIRVISNGAKWLAILSRAAEDATSTVAS